jgi:hypothetical protein
MTHKRDTISENAKLDGGGERLQIPDDVLHMHNEVFVALFTIITQLD